MRMLLVVLWLATSQCALAAEAPPGAYKPDAGPHVVGQIGGVALKQSGAIVAEAADASDIPLLVRYPVMAATSDSAKGQGEPRPAPVILFSHGAGGSSDAFAELSRHWASHGYIVIHPTHADSIQRRRAAGDNLRDLARDPQEIVRGVDLRGRCVEMQRILRHLDKIERSIRADAGAARRAPRIDRERVVIAGHSAGAMTAQALGGMQFFLNSRGRGRSMADKRFKAAIIISGQGTTRRTLSEKSWEAIRIPWLVIAGSEDVSSVSNETPASRRHPFEHAPPGDKYLVYIDGATHSSYAGKSRQIGDATPLKADLDYVQSVVAFSTTAFLDCYMEDQPDAREYLQSDAITRFPGGKVDYQKK